MSASTYVCLLRGINVSGHKMMKMDRLRACLESIGLKEVRTYLQSGNAVFDVPAPLKKDLAKTIGSKIADDFGFTVPILVLSSKEWEKARTENPFLKEKGIDPGKLHVTFLATAPATAALEKLALLKAGEDQYREIGQRLYLYCPGGYGNTKLSNQAIERILKVEATTRNWKTVNALAGMLQKA